jgi:hypothetical protein
MATSNNNDDRFGTSTLPQNFEQRLVGPKLASLIALRAASPSAEIELLFGRYSGGSDVC